MEKLLNIDWTSVDWGKVLASAAFAAFVRIAVLLCVGVPVALFVSRAVRKRVAKRYSPHYGMLVGKAIYYGALAYVAVAVLRDLGFPLTALFGAAGIVGVALGFASQTSVSNVISGFFLIAEKPFVIGDVVNMADTVGEILSIDMLSVKMRTFDNQFVRIPNETIVKSKVVNISRFPIRRVDINIGVAYKEDIAHVREVLLSVAHDMPQCLEEPAPIIIMTGFGESSLTFLFAVWAAREDWLAVKNGIQEQIKKRFDEEGIEIPFPHRSLYVGSLTDPFPIRLVAESPSPLAAAVKAPEETSAQEAPSQ